MIVYRCDICGKETSTFRSLTFKRSEIRSGQIVQPESMKSVDVCSDLCELQAASELLRSLSKASSLDEEGRPFRKPPPVHTDPGPDSTGHVTWEQIAYPHRR